MSPEPVAADTAGAPARSFVTDRPVAVFVITLATVVFGYFASQKLPLALMPELSYPTLTVRTEYPGAAPEEVENDISRPLEEALGVIGGLRRVSSISRAGVSDVVLEFSWDTEMSEASQDTLEKIDLVFLPTEAERPLILRYDPSLDPVMELSLSGSGDRFAGEEGLRRLRRLGDREIKRALEPIKGVAAVRVRGGLEEQIEIRLDEEKLRRSGLSAQSVASRLAQENVNVAGGTIKEGRTEYMVRTVNEYEGLGQIRETVVATLDGRAVRVGDLGEVAWSHEEQQMLTRTDGELSVQIDLFKEGDANIVDLADRVKARIGELDLAAETRRASGQEVAKPKRPSWGPPKPEEQVGLSAQIYRAEGAVLKVVADRSVFIRRSLDEVKSSAVMGGLLAVVVLLLFLRNFWTTMIVALSIPISLFITFAPLDLAGLTLNIMSLGGLALGVGMLVDNSIVVLESIFRCREEGDDVATAAVRGTAEVKSAVISSTLTTVAVFFPMVFVEGIAGQAFADLGVAVVASLLASLVVAIYLVPMLASRTFGGAKLDSEASPEAGAKAARWSPREDFAALRATLTAPLAGGWRRLPSLFGRLILLVIGPVYLLARWVVMGLLLLLLWICLALLRGVLGLWRLVRSAGRGLTRLWRPRHQDSPSDSPTEQVPSGFLASIRVGYEQLVRGAVRNPGIVVALMLVLLAVTAWLGSRLGSELLPEVHQGELTLEVALPVGTPLEESEAILAPVEQAILAARDHIRALILTVGFDPETSQRSDEGEHTARFKVLLDSSDPRVEAEVVARLRAAVRSVPDAAARVVRPVLFSFKTPVEVEIYGDDLASLKRSSDQARERLAALPQLADVEATLKRGAPEVQIVYDREMLSRYGLNLRQVATLIRDQVKGAEATRFNLKDRRIPVLVRLGEDDRESVADVEGLMVNPGGVRPVPLSAVSAVTLGEGPSEVRRIDARRAAVIGANLRASGGASLTEAVEAIERTLSREMSWPADQTFFISGQSAEWQKSQSSLLLALGLSLFLVYVIMASQFESLLQPLVIMFSIPLAFFGTVLALAATSTPISIVVFLGAILLGGVVVNNAIVLIDYVNLLRSRGVEREAALVTAGTVRLRPILMTTGTTVLGLVPMALGFGDGAEIRTPLAITVIGGLSVSTLLTLLVIPSLYAVTDDWKLRLSSWRRGRRQVVEPVSPAALAATGEVAP